MLTHSYSPEAREEEPKGSKQAKCLGLVLLLLAAAVAVFFLVDWRRQSASEERVIAVLEQTPESNLLQEDIKKRWSALGPIDLQKMISKGKIRFEVSFDVGVLVLDEVFYQG